MLPLIVSIEQKEGEKYLKIEYIYRDLLAGAHQTESNWTKMQYNLIDQASKPSEDACKKALENIDIKLSKIKEIINKLSKFIK